MKVDEGSCQNESILPNPENSEKLHMCVPNPMELCQVFLQCNEMESTEKQNLYVCFVTSLIFIIYF